MCPPSGLDPGGGITNPTMATKLNLTIDQGATFSQTIAVGVSYSGYTVRGKIRQAGFLGATLAEFTCTAVSVGGDTTISLTAAQTAALCAPTWSAADERLVDLGVYDLELVSGATVVRSREGIAKLSREATYDD
jgi:hypothetical protein